MADVGDATSSGLIGSAPIEADALKFKRCSVWPSSGSGTSGAIRRIVNPEFRREAG